MLLDKLVLGSGFHPLCVIVGIGCGLAVGLRASAAVVAPKILVGYLLKIFVWEHGPRIFSILLLRLTTLNGDVFLLELASSAEIESRRDAVDMGCRDFNRRVLHHQVEGVANALVAAVVEAQFGENGHLNSASEGESSVSSNGLGKFSLAVGHEFHLRAGFQSRHCSLDCETLRKYRSCRQDD